ncbi:methyltransferase domain-containing protein [Massilia atriviolacea]|uniref:Malonyl-[acyl-carrier protein] O-methyltransferase n=1 Tax=Massilia atriviolacea TaxID=2495579 RepID=A0A430HLX3_9BURK|nr:methyltransferase domain-containing protein [Massilia atriviolacea]RSZ58567.1 methyltransferase domain-containing protein [Massilia atriviolacea]
MNTPDTLSAPIDLARVRSLFSRPQRVAQSDFLRREIASRMHERLLLVKAAPRRVLDAGCGSGADLALLQKDYPAAHILGLDAAVAMVEAAKTPASALKSLISRLMPAKAGVDLLCGDFGNMPLGPNSVDLVWSNLALHWHPQPDRVFAEWRRVLRQDGLLMFSNFGPDTLRELRTAFAEADGPAASPRVLPFVDMHDFGDQLVAAGFSTPVMDMEVITVTYDTAAALLADARALGGNPLATRARGLSGRAAWGRMLAALERQRRPDGKLGLTFEVIYGHAFRPAPRVTAAGEAIIRFEPRKGR